MAPATHTARSLDSTLHHSQTKKPITRHPTTVPLPPSPPATETLNLEDGSHESIQTSRSRRSKDASKKLNSSLNRSRPQPTLLKLPIKRSRQDESGGGLDQSSVEPASPISSPLSSPTTRKAHPHKRTKVDNHKISSSINQPLEVEESSVPLSPNFRDSPNNPFLVKEGESDRRAGRFHDEKSRKLVYVFRGKRIQYDPGEDLHNTGDSPFTLSAPKLLFPTHPVTSPSAPPRLEFESHQSTEEQPSSGIDPFQTPKRNSKKTLKVGMDPVGGMLPTPQTRTRRTHHDFVGVNQVEIGSTKGKQTISKGMR